MYNKKHKKNYKNFKVKHPPKKKTTSLKKFIHKRKKNLKIVKNYILKKNFKYLIHIRITPNNIFCTFRNLKKTLAVLTAGIIKLKVSKRKLKFAYKQIIGKFIKAIKKRTAKETSVLYISGPKKVRKKATKHIIKRLKYNKLLVKILEKKSFNGCRPKKAKRKKRKGFRVFK